MGNRQTRSKRTDTSSRTDPCSTAAADDEPCTTRRHLDVLPHAWFARPNPAVAVNAALPHHVVSQIIRPEVAAFMAPDTVRWATKSDVEHSVSTLQLKPLEDINPSPEVFEFATTLPHLVALDLSFSTVGTEFLALVATLTRLEEFDIGHCPKVTFAGLEHVAKLSRLRVLSLLNCSTGVEPALPVLCAGLTELEVLNVSGTDTARKGLESIATLQNLTTLHLTQCQNIDAPGLRVLSQGAPKLRTLCLVSCYRASGRGAREAVRHIPNVYGLGALESPPSSPTLSSVLDLNGFNLRQIGGDSTSSDEPSFTAL